MYHFKIYGNNQLLAQPAIAIHASRQAPGDLLLATNNLFKHLLLSKIVIGSGWHSPLEKQLLDMYNAKSVANLLIFIAKKFENYRLPKNLKAAYDNQKIAIIEPAVDSERISRITVSIRDQILDDLIDRHLFLFIRPEGRLAKRFERLKDSGKTIFVLDHPENRRFIQKGVRVADSDTLNKALLF